MKRRKESPTDADLLREWLKTVPYGDYNKHVKCLVEACAVSLTTFNNWRFGKCRITQAGKRDINQYTLKVSGKEIFTMTEPGEGHEA